MVKEELDAQENINTIITRDIEPLFQQKIMLTMIDPFTFQVPRINFVYIEKKKP